MKRYSLHGQHGQVTVSQARYCPNQFTLEFQARGSRWRETVFADWRAYARAYTFVFRPMGRININRFLGRRWELLGF